MKSIFLRTFIIKYSSLISNKIKYLQLKCQVNKYSRIFKYFYDIILVETDVILCWFSQNHYLL